MPTPEIPLNALNPGRDGALKGGKCRICSLSLRTLSAIDEKLRRGDTVLQVAKWARKTFKNEGLDLIKDDIFYRHRQRHVQLVDRAARKLSDGERLQHQKMRLAKAVLEDRVDPQAYFGPAAIAQDILKTSVRLDLAADDAFVGGEHSALAALSGQLLRSHELRGKLGGTIRDGGEVNLTVTIGELHQKLDGILGANQSERHGAARALLGISGPSSLVNPVETSSDTTDPVGGLTIDAEPELGATPVEPAPNAPFPASPGASEEPTLVDRLGQGGFEEPLGTRFRQG